MIFMTRIGKQEERRHKSPRRRQKAIPEKTGPKKITYPLDTKKLQILVRKGPLYQKLNKRKKCPNIKVMEKQAILAKKETF